MDIVERLRLFAKDDAPTAAIYDVALRRADEIERLREALTEIANISNIHNDYGDIMQEIAREALKEKE